MINSSTKCIAFIQSGWHSEIVDQCRVGFIAEIAELGYSENQIDFFKVPGAFELPLQAKMLAKTGRYLAVVVTGMVVNGGIYRHEFVADAVIAGFMQTQLETEVPLITAVLTPQNFHEHSEHQRFFFEHFLVKGREAAHACVQTIANLEVVRAPQAVAA